MGLERSKLTVRSALCSIRTLCGFIVVYVDSSMELTFVKRAMFQTNLSHMYPNSAQCILTFDVASHCRSSGTQILHCCSNSGLCSNSDNPDTGFRFGFNGADLQLIYRMSQVFRSKNNFSSWIFKNKKCNSCVADV